MKITNKIFHKYRNTVKIHGQRLYISTLKPIRLDWSHMYYSLAIRNVCQGIIHVGPLKWLIKWGIVEGLTALLVHTFPRTHARLRISRGIDTFQWGLLFPNIVWLLLTALRCRYHIGISTIGESNSLQPGLTEARFSCSYVHALAASPLHPRFVYISLKHKGI